MYYDISHSYARISSSGSPDFGKDFFYGKPVLSYSFFNVQPKNTKNLRVLFFLVPVQIGSLIWIEVSDVTLWSFETQQEAPRDDGGLHNPSKKRPYPYFLGKGGIGGG